MDSKRFSWCWGLLVAALLMCMPSVAQVETVSIAGSKGRLAGQIEFPHVRKDRMPVTIILHGLTGYRTEPQLNAVAEELLANGVAVVRFDFNGHGESDGEFVEMTLDNELEDAVCIYQFVKGQPWCDKERISLVGHSQGGLIAGVLAGVLGKEKVRNVVLLAPAACIHTMGLTGNLFGKHYDYESLPEYIDFWGGRHLGREYLKSAVRMDVYGITSRYTGPVCIIQGLNDSPELIVDAEAYKKYLSDCNYITLEGLSHCYPEDLATPARLSRQFIVE